MSKRTKSIIAAIENTFKKHELIEIQEALDTKLIRVKPEQPAQEGMAYVDAMELQAFSYQERDAIMSRISDAFMRYYTQYVICLKLYRSFGMSGWVTVVRDERDEFNAIYDELADTFRSAMEDRKKLSGTIATIVKAGDETLLDNTPLERWLSGIVSASSELKDALYRAIEHQDIKRLQEMYKARMPERIRAMQREMTENIATDTDYHRSTIYLGKKALELREHTRSLWKRLHLIYQELALAEQQKTLTEDQGEVLYELRQQGLGDSDFTDEEKRKLGQWLDTKRRRYEAYLEKNKV